MKKHILFLAAFPAAVAAQQAPPIRLINAPTAKTQPILGLAAAVRELPNGSLLVNDVTKRQLLMLDPSLANASIVADSVSGGANSYGPRPGGIIPYLGDSTLFIDPAGLSMFVIDPNGAISRVASVPRSQDASFLGNNVMSAPALDGKGRIVYRTMGGQRITMGGAPPANGAARTSPAFQMAEPPDTAAIVRVDIATRKLDTAGFYKIPKTKMNMNHDDKGNMSLTIEVNPLPIVDDWAVLSDGSIAIVRGRDYHIDWINPDGTLTTSPKLPFDWQRLSDDDKIAVIDSAKAAGVQGMMTMGGPGAGVVRSGVEGAAAGAAAGRTVTTIMSMGGDGGGGMRTSFGGPGGANPMQFVSPSELPDYRPPFVQNSLKADLDGNLWIRTTSVRAGSVGGGPVYDVVDRKGQLIDRLQIPSGRTIVGFGRGGVVYMVGRDEKGSWLEKTKR